MNLLAHFYCSHIHLPISSEEVMIGNFIADFIRGNPSEHYSSEMVRGIRLHRAIDSFTDAHVLPRQSAARLKAEFGRYAPVVVDVLYDHVLAREWQMFAPDIDVAIYPDANASPANLTTFAKETYRICMNNLHIMPERVAAFVPYMVNDNWLVNYSTRYGMERSLESLSRRALYASGFERAVETLETHYEDFRDEFCTFFPEVVAMSHEFLSASL